MNEIDFAQARQVATAKLVDLGKDDRFVLVESRTREYRFGWVFEAVPEAYARSGNSRDLVPGIGPLIVRRDGKAEFLTSSMPPAMAVRAYEQRWESEQPK